jgi:hypothetical protein
VTEEVVTAPAIPEPPATPVGPKPDTSSAYPLWRIRYNRLRRRIVGGLRDAFRLPEDATHEYLMEQLRFVGGIRRDHENLVKALQNANAKMNRMDARLGFYEQRIPSIRKEFSAFLVLEKKAAREFAKAQAKASPDAAPEPGAG